MKKLIYSSLIVLGLFTSCENQDWEFPDYDYTTVYFPYQTPVRTIVLGEDLYDNTLDNEHKCLIMAAMGGVYENKTDRILDVVVDNDMFDSLLFNGDSGSYIIPMPANYYSLESTMQIVIPAGSTSGGIEVQLSDAFFNDPRSVENTYVIPLRIESVTNADSILRGEALIPNPDVFNPDNWSVAPKDYILYCVKYINPYSGSYLRRGQDICTGTAGNSALDTNIIYHNEYVERNQVVNLSTVSMNEVAVSLTTREAGNSSDLAFELSLNIDANGSCSVKAPQGASYTVSGSGNLVKDGDSWGGEERDVFHLQYVVSFSSSVHTITDTLVIRDRGVAFETFEAVGL
ncbi:MAG: DUF1735 domain-containing protein [Bacteroidales bacterium]|nr:DUF1735 domain-containing protein [Bacteroidales bacterium]MBN2820760.1 DUF1735 domain-containing protein [Bacteroidales bacterium]